MDNFKDIAGNEKTVTLFRSTFQAPLPMAGSASSSLGDLPAGLDYVSAQGSKRELSMTTWNTQSHHYQTCVGYTIDTVVTNQGARSTHRPTILFDGALNQVVTLRRQFLNGQGRYISSLGQPFYTLPSLYSARSSPYTDAQAASIALAYDEGRLTNEPPHDMPGDSDTGEVTPTTSTTTAETSGSQYTGATAPGKSKAALVVPLRSVRTVAMTFKGFKKS